MLANGAILRERSGESRAQIEMTIHPFGNTLNALSSTQQVVGILFAIILLLGWAFIPAAFVEFIVRERQLGVKHQLLISGTSIFSYWLSNVIFDFIISCCSLVLVTTIITVAAYAGNIEYFQVHYEPETFFAFIILIAAYYVVAAPMMYFVSWFFKRYVCCPSYSSPSSASLSLTITSSFSVSFSPLFSLYKFVQQPIARDQHHADCRTRKRDSRPRIFRFNSD